MADTPTLGVTAGIVAGQFALANSYSDTAVSSARSFISALDGLVYSAPSVNVTWNTIATPDYVEVPALDGGVLPEITVNVPTNTPPALTIPEPTYSIDDFTDVMDPVSFGTAPTISYGSMPTVPSLGTVEVPVSPTVDPVAAPTYLTLTPVSFGGVDLHADWLTKLDTIPELGLIEPTPYTYARGPEYASALLSALKAKLAERLAGGTGLAPTVEQAIWDRARDRETAIAQANIDDLARQSEALGFDLPSGAMAAQMRQVQQDYYDKLSTLSRDVAVKQAELEQENIKQTIAESMQLEGKLVDYSYQLERLTFETAKQYADNAIQVYNAGVEGYKALLTGYQAYEAAYKTIIEGEMTKVEVYKAELQAEMTKAQINTALVEQYKAAISAQMSKVEIYKAQVGAAQTLVQLEQAKIGAAAEQIKAYVAQINGETAKVEAYKAGVQAEVTKVEVFKTKAQAFSAKVSAQAEKAKADLSRYTALLQAKTQEWEGYKARVNTETERIRALGIQSGTVLDAYKASASAIEANARLKTTVWEGNLKQYEAGKQLALQADKINMDALLQTNNARLDAAKTGAQVYAQLAASANGMAHAGASLSSGESNSFGRSISYNYSNDTMTAAPTTT